MDEARPGGDGPARDPFGLRAMEHEASRLRSRLAAGGGRLVHALLTGAPGATHAKVLREINAMLDAHDAGRSQELLFGDGRGARPS